MESWEADGYVLLRNFFSPQQVQNINELVDSLWQSRSTSPLVIDTFLGTPQSRRVQFSSVGDEVRQRPYKLNDLYLEHDEVRQLVLDRKLNAILKQLLNGTPLAFNTLNFEYGSGQDDHLDTFYMPPKKPGGMVASWIALEPIELEAGPLRYYPGSHRIKPWVFSTGKPNVVPAELPAFYDYMYKEMEQLNIKPHVLTAQPGDVFIWHSRLFHGGEAIKNPQLTRRSLVTHYFRRNEYRHVFWRLKRLSGAYYYQRPHQIPR